MNTENFGHKSTYQTNEDVEILYHNIFTPQQAVRIDKKSQIMKEDVQILYLIQIIATLTLWCAVAMSLIRKIRRDE